MRAVRGRRAAAALRLPLWISLRTTWPRSTNFGYDRGTPIDRFYLDEFVRERSGDVRGDVLEVKSTVYADRFGSVVGYTGMTNRLPAPPLPHATLRPRPNPAP